MSKLKWERATDGYVEVVRVDRRGRKRKGYVYQGEHYVCSVGKLTGGKLKQITLLLTVCSAVLLCCSTTRPAFFNVLFYAGGFSFAAWIPMLFVAVGTVRFLVVKEAMPVQQYYECHNSLCYGGICTAILLLLSAAGGICAMASGGISAAVDTWVLIMNAVVLVLQAVSAWIHKKDHYHIQLEEEV